MDEIFEVEVLQNGNEFLAKHEGCFLGESPSTQVLQFLHRSIQLFEADEVVVLLLATPVHMGDSDASLHYLEDFPLLKDGKHLIVRPHFVLLALHEYALRGLRVDAPVEQVLVLPLDLRDKPEPSDQPDFDGPHY